MKTLLICLVGTLSIVAVEAVELRILAWDDAVSKRPLALVSGGKPIEITDLHPLKRSKHYPGPSKDAPITIRALDRPLKEGTQTEEVTCKVGPDVLNPLLILLPDPKAPGGLRGLVVEDNPSSFKWGTMRFLNASGGDVVVQCERKAVRVPAGWNPVDISPGGDSRNVGIRIALASSIEKPAYTSVWEHQSDTRSVVFILRGGDSRLGTLTLKVIPEVKGAEAAGDISSVE
jgi:hypothetical protein